MRLTAALLVATSLLTPARATGQADTLSPVDRAMLQRDLAASGTTFLASIEGLNDAQWLFKPAPNRWSIAEVAEHVVATNRLIHGMITVNLPPATPHPADSLPVLDQRIRLGLADRSSRFDAPQVIQPAGAYATREALLQAFQESRDSLNRYLATTRDPLRTRGIPHPVFGPLDGVQWVILVAGHEKRHSEQIEEVKKSEGYPSK